MASKTKSGRPGLRPTGGWIAAALIVLAVTPYVQTLNHGFVNFDDNLHVTDNAVVQQGLTWSGVRWAWTTFQAYNWHPLTWLSHMLDCTLFVRKDGTQWAGGHHLVNLLLHTVNTSLVWAVLRRLTGATWRSAWVAALFAVHPLHVESVAWVAERKDVLSTLFGLLALWCYADYARRGGGARYLAVFGCFTLSLLSKPMLVTLPAVLLLLDVWPLERWRAAARAVVLEKIPLLVLSGASCVVTLQAQLASKAVSSFEKLSLDARVANAVVAYATYLLKLVAPVHLSVFYPHPGAWAAWRVAVAAVVLVCVTVVTVLQRRERPWLMVGWLWYLGMLVPVIGLVQVGTQSMADRYTYLPAIGVFLAIVWSVPEVATVTARRAWGSVACIVLIVLTAVSTVQASYWRDSRTLFTHSLAVTRGNFMAHQNLGHALAQAGDLAGAMEQYRRAIALRPDYALVRENLANALIRSGGYGEAMEQLSAAIQYDPSSYSAHNSMGAVLFQLRRVDEAERALRRAVELEPNSIDARANHGLALVELRRWDEAIAELSIVRRLSPRYAAARTNLGLALAGNGRREEAIAELQEVLRVTPDYGPARDALRRLLP